jgi:hypothetical protein
LSHAFVGLVLFSRLLHTPVGSHCSIRTTRRSPSPIAFLFFTAHFSCSLLCTYLFLIIYHVFDPIMSLLDLMHERSMKAWRLFFSEHFAVEVL